MIQGNNICEGMENKVIGVIDKSENQMIEMVKKLHEQQRKFAREDIHKITDKQKVNQSLSLDQL